MIGGAVTRATTGVELTRCGDPVVSQGVGFEACGRLLVTSGPSTDAQSVTLIGVRFAADQLHEDGACIRLRHAGPLTLIGGSYGDGDQRVPQIHLAGTGDQAVHIAGAKFGAFGSDQQPVIRVNPGVRSFVTGGVCTYQRNESSSERTKVAQIPLAISA